MTQYFLKEIFQIDSFIDYLNTILQIKKTKSNCIYYYNDFEIATISYYKANGCITWEDIIYTEFGKQFIKEELINYIKNIK